MSVATHSSPSVAETPFRARSVAGFILPGSLAGLLLLLCGCGALVATTAPLTVAPSANSLPGKVRGGQQPISGASIQLYAVGTTGDGGPATPLLNTAVTTNSSGGFSLTGLYTCPSSSTLVYIAAIGGNPGLSTSAQNPQIAMMSLLGECGSLTPETQINIDELSTVASVGVLAPFMRSVANVGSASADAGAMASAFTAATILYNSATGAAPGPNVPAGYTVPVATLNTLADLLESCVNSTGGTAGDGSACGNLFAASATTSAVPTDTISAALNIATHPTVALTQLFNLAAPVASFVPSLTQPPATWSVAPILTSALPTVQASAAESFVNSVGLNVHFSYYGTIYTNQSAQMIADIQRLGVLHLRDQMAWEGTAVANSPFYAIHNQFGPLGIRTDYIMTSLSYPASQVAVYPSLVNDMEAAEPANEADNTGDPNWVAEVTAQQTALYSTVVGTAGTPAIPGVTVLAPSLGHPSYAPQLGNMSAISNVGNSHTYLSGWNPGNSGTGGAENPAYFLDLAAENNPNQPVWVTETGYWSVPGSYGWGYGVDEATQAIYVPRMLLDFWNAGAARTYLYELADEIIPPATTPATCFGLVRSDGSAKPAFPALANLLSLLSDSGGNFTPSSLAYRIDGANSQVQQALFQKSDGSFYLAIWVEAQSYDFLNQVPIAVPAQSVNLQLSRTVLSATSYQWDTAGNVTSTALAPAQTLPLTVTDKLQIVQLVLR